MINQTLANKLMMATVESIALMTSSYTDLDELLYALSYAAQQRAMVGKNQFEDVWQQEIEDAKGFWIVASLKLSPYSLQSVEYECNNLNSVEWQIYLPNINYIKEGKAPKNINEYLLMAILGIVKHDDAYEDKDLSIFLDKINFTQIQ